MDTFKIMTGIIIAIVIGFGVFAYQFSSMMKENREQNILEWTAEDMAMLEEIKSVRDCDDMFVTIMKYDNDWYKSANRKDAWNTYKEMCITP